MIKSEKSLSKYLKTDSPDYPAYVKRPSNLNSLVWSCDIKKEQIMLNYLPFPEYIIVSFDMTFQSQDIKFIFSLTVTHTLQHGKYWNLSKEK